MPRYPNTSLYDSYRLSNSQVVPMYQGSAAPEALKVGEYMQQLYDTARTKGNEVGDATENIVNMKADQALADELRNNVIGKIGEFAKAGNWEDHLEDVTHLGRQFYNRAKELQAPVLAYQEWKKGLDDKEKNLTTTQKAGYEQMALEGYKGLQKDPNGKFSGSFTGELIAKNINKPEWVDKVMKDIAIQKGGTLVSTDDGYAIRKDSGKYEILTPDTIEKTLSYAMRGDTEFQDYLKMQGRLAGFRAGKEDPSQFSPPSQAKIKEYTDKGYSPKEAATMAFDEIARNQEIQDAINYAKTKYTMNNRWTEHERGLGDIEKAKAIKELDNNHTTAVVTDTLDNVATDFSDLEKSKTDYTEQLKSAAQKIDMAKASVRADYEAKHGLNSWGKLSGDQQEQEITRFTTTHPGGAGVMQGLANARNAYKEAHGKLQKINDMGEYVENYVLSSQFGRTKDQLSGEVKRDITAAAGSVGDKKINVLIDGKWKNITGKELTNLVKDAKFSKTGSVSTIEAPSITDHPMDAASIATGAGGSGAGLSKPLILQSAAEFILPDGRKLHVTDNAGGRISTVVGRYAAQGNLIQDAIKRSTKEALNNYSQTTGVIVTSNKKINDEMTAITRAAQKKVYNSTGQEITGSDADKIINQINGGNFEYIGTYTEQKGGQGHMIKVSVQDKSKKDSTPETYRIGLTDTGSAQIADKMIGEATVRNAQGRIVQIKDPEGYAAGLALRPNSAYNTINKTKQGEVAKVTSGGKTLYTVSRTTIDGLPYTTVRDANGVIKDIGDQLQVGAWLEAYRADKNYNVEFK